jgi:predicted permease
VIVRWLLRLFVSDADRRTIEADLAELYDVRRARDGQPAADRWRRRQRAMLPAHLLADRARSAVTSFASSLPDLLRESVRSARSLSRTPALAVTIVLTVGVGLGATTGLLAVVDGVLLRPLPYQQPDALYWIYTDNPPYRFRFSVVDYRALEADHPAFSAVAGYQTTSVTITAADQAERVNAKSVTGSYFPLVGQHATIGRLFTPADDAHGDRIAVLTAAYWQRRFGGNPAIVGTTVDIDGAPHVVVGVLQPEVGPFEQDIAVFTAARWPEPKRRGPFFTMAIGRLRSDVSPRDAAAALHATNRRLFPIWKSSYQDERATWNLQPLHERVVGDIGTTLAIVLGAVALVLLIACANAVNLLVARSLTHARELAIRSALGASRVRLLRQLLIDAGLLTTAAAVVGVVVSIVVIELIRTYGADYIPRTTELGLSPAALGWMVALTAGSGLIIFLGGLGSLSHAVGRSAVRLDDALRASTRGGTDRPGTRRLRRVLVAAQFALATPLVVAAVLVIASLERLSAVDVGFDMSRLLTAEIALPPVRYGAEEIRRAFWDRVADRLSRAPGVEAVAIADSRPPVEAGNLNNFDLEDRPTPPGENQPICTWVAATPGFFDAVGLRLERGRLLDDRSADENVVVVDRAWANRFFPGQEVVGRRFREGGCTTCPWTTVVGLVGTVKWQGLDASDEGTVYYQFADFPSGFVLVRSAGDPLANVAGVRQAFRDLDPGLALANVATGTELLSTSITQPRYLTVVISVFSLAALTLSLIGIYGVMSYAVEQRRREIGIRLALGGRPDAVRRMLVGQGVQLVSIGIAAGIAAAFATSQWLSSVLFEISATDLRAVGGAAVGLVGLAAIAALIPARRAARIDPSLLLRDG